METNNNDIDKLFKDTLDGHSSPYVSGAWERMEAMLDDGNRGILRENMHRYVLSSIVGSIILAGSVIAYVTGYNTTTGTFTESNPAQEQTVIAENTTTPITGNDAQTDNNVANPTDKNITATTAAPTGEKTTRIAANTKRNTKKTTATTAKQTVDNAPVNENDAAIADNNTTASTGEQENTTIDVADNPAVTAITNEVAEESTGEKRAYQLTSLTGKTLQVGINPFDNTILDAETKKGKESFTAAEQERLERISKRNAGKLNFGFMLGGNINSVLSNTGATGWGKGLLAGVYFSKNFRKFPRWGANIGLNYVQSTGNSIGRSITQTTYFFEKKTTSYYLLTKSFDYLQIPISAQYTAGLNHRFTMGFVASFLANSQTEVAEKTEKTGEYIANTKTEKGVYEDLNRFGYGLMAGYEYQLPGIYSIGVRYQQQFNDITANSFFNDTKKHLPASIQLYLKLNITR